jgi:hypothetical protein
MAPFKIQNVSIGKNAEITKRPEIRVCRFVKRELNITFTIPESHTHHINWDKGTVVGEGSSD